MNKPFLLKPAAKDYLWGGNRLNEEFAKEIDAEPLAETWECSTHPDGLSVVSTGIFYGKSLHEVLSEHKEYLGTHPLATFQQSAAGQLPILIKFIDANKDLSVQVHPTDEYAGKNEDGQLGKTEMWYVLDAKLGASLVYGLSQSVAREEMEIALDKGDVEKYLQKVPVKKNDVFNIEAGTIHAIGAGVLVAEIQENSNLTYRLYDYDRTDKNGKKRELHIKKGLDVADLNKATEPRQPLRVLRYQQGVARELLSRCKYFEVYRMIVNTERRQKVTFKSDELSFRVLLCVNGCGTISFEEEQLQIYKGDCLFIPADSVEMRLHGKMQFLDVRC
ncbi:mannose-6-phosphate isomerase [Pseudobutyrivibrio sp. UC1225]|uniref:type I phosphomannose isomerase catalytic subunit n=1 Tax=Pseudobutyrivibrio sp. UC1225 TaxID=1798185 RepID=UPI0008F2AD1D|nr:type I phosphomannose isomerase catalytic subunit [Pseudobutyrivibrio sp. UC1225]SFO22054.1 mannose-6-phosphate isomerase [Pseudobutyrivibrio sp. UC1225]